MREGSRTRAADARASRTGTVALPFCNLRLRGSRAPDFPISYARHPKTLAEHLRKERLFRRLRQRDLAEQLGVTEMTVSNWERGKERPLARHLGAIIRFLGFDPSPPPQNLHERLRAIRLRLGLTQEEMGRKLGFDEWCVNRWESGARQPSRWMATRLAGLLDAIERGDSANPTGSDLRYFDLTRWSRRPPTGVLAVQPVTLGERIRHARISRGMSQAAAARLLGTTLGTLYRWESDSLPVARNRIAAVQKFLRPRILQRRRRN